MGDTSASTAADDDLLLKSFFAEVSEVERDNEVLRLICREILYHLFVSFNFWILILRDSF